MTEQQLYAIVDVNVAELEGTINELLEVCRKDGRSPQAAFTSLLGLALEIARPDLIHEGGDGNVIRKFLTDASEYIAVYAPEGSVEATREKES